VQSLGPYRNEMVQDVNKNNMSTDQMRQSPELLGSKAVDSFSSYNSARVLPQNLVPIVPMRSELPSFYTKGNLPIKRNSLPNSETNAGKEGDLLTHIRKPKAETL
jgi:hypothetical protein